jgi:hypothetical protein
MIPVCIAEAGLIDVATSGHRELPINRIGPPSLLTEWLFI